MFSVYKILFNYDRDSFLPPGQTVRPKDPVISVTVKDKAYTSLRLDTSDSDNHMLLCTDENFTLEQETDLTTKMTIESLSRLDMTSTYYESESHTSQVNIDFTSGHIETTVARFLINYYIHRFSFFVFFF
jgi:hypothetical protein